MTGISGKVAERSAHEGGSKGAPTKSVSRELAEWSQRLRYEDLPPEVVECAKRFLFDSIGCAFGGYGSEDVEIAMSLFEEAGGAPQATLIGSGKKTSALHASFLNSLMIRALDFNDIYWKQDPSHPSDIMPAAFAAGELASDRRHRARTRDRDAPLRGGLPRNP
jgi:2-methylcitrate dehydratase